MHLTTSSLVRQATSLRAPPRGRRRTIDSTSVELNDPAATAPGRWATGDRFHQRIELAADHRSSAVMIEGSIPYVWILHESYPIWRSRVAPESVPRTIDLWRICYGIDRVLWREPTSRGDRHLSLA